MLLVFSATLLAVAGADGDLSNPKAYRPAWGLLIATYTVVNLLVMTLPWEALEAAAAAHRKVKSSDGGGKGNGGIYGKGLAEKNSKEEDENIGLLSGGDEDDD